MRWLAWLVKFGIPTGEKKIICHSGRDLRNQFLGLWKPWTGMNLEKFYVLSLKKHEYYWDQGQKFSSLWEIRARKSYI